MATAIKKVDIYRGHLATVPCPRCSVPSLYHPKHSLDKIHCIEEECGFTDTTVEGGRREEHGEEWSSKAH